MPTSQPGKCCHVERHTESRVPTQIGAPRSLPSLRPATIPSKIAKHAYQLRKSGLVVRAQVDGAALRLARLERGMTQSELADVLRVAGGERVSAWERGVNQPDVRLVPVLAEVLGVDPAALIGQRPPSKPFKWKFTTTDLNDLLERLDKPTPTAKAA